MDFIDANSGFELSPTKDKIIIKEDGAYFVMASGQMGVISASGSGYMDVWFVKNGTPVPNSNCRLYMNNSSATDVLISQAVIPLKTGDSIATGYSASGPALGFIFTQPDNEPAIPSFIFSIFKLGEL